MLAPSLLCAALAAVPPPEKQCLFSGATLRNQTGALVSCSRFAGRHVALYFAGEWCPRCRGFTPALRAFYREYADTTDIVFVSSDLSAEAARSHFEGSQGGWLALDWADPLAAALKRRYRVWSGLEMAEFGTSRRSGVPAVVLVDARGEEVAFLPAEREGARALTRFSRDWRRWPEEL